MARARDPNRDKAFEIYKSNQGIELTEIASQLNIPVTTVRSWKARDKWECNATQCNASRKAFDDGTRETMLNEDLTHEQRLFCIYYSKTFNATQSYLKAYGRSYDVANAEGYKMLVKPCVKKEIERLKEIKRQQIVASESDIVEMHMKIAFSDIGDYLNFGRKTIENDGSEFEVNYVDFKESSNVDTQLIQEVKQGREGVSIKLADKQKSLDWLDKHFMYNPMDKHKIEFDKLKLEMERKKLEPEERNEGVKYSGIPATMVAPAFSKVIFDIENQEHTEYVFPGGRGSTKSSFISTEVIDLIEKNPDMHACVLRQVKDTLRDSVYQQMLWAISALGLEDEYKCTTSPLEITKKSTGQKIFFRGADDPFKIKSIKAPFGYIGVAWFEELDQFKGAEQVRNMEQSLIRGGEKAYIFKSFNPPKSAINWANKYIKVPKANRLITHSTYLDVPKQWLGKPFIDEAEFLKEVNPTAYENEYMGVANGTGGNIFDNLTVRTITNEEAATFDRLYFGVDWGWYPDPWTFNKVYYNAQQHKLYILDEDRRNKTSNEKTAKILKEEHGINPNDKIVCDSAENKSIEDYRSYGLFARGAIKGPNSVEYSMKWLQSLSEIIIDNTRTPNTATEFLDYEYERDKEGNVLSGYPDANNHHIDAIRYALEEIWRRRGM
ncbi:PBSX family phage terminase large subunit [Anaerosacchariphilus polymeriproducens]|uniref:PBSX family phage terminase large subunit n=1 Tax=Anaerosacchariphilus polymeriproducens TaxID=1812858 RepID=A0A371AR69_9FIRM|nr:PBSX family phage terminase large subunit [Anaerosacchariphilus polymeriproducens]RDU21930.1 PBSX family phage terminase large subunit [Anaerosacchariphilus polymeriproducens]